MAHLKDLIGKRIAKVQMLQGGIFDGGIALITSDDERFIIMSEPLTGEICANSIIKEGDDFSKEMFNKSYRDDGSVETWASLLK
jgi:predicted negative regulator of RcsB-dependent stress response